ncbi:MAG: hypothetical protein KFF45_03800 [Thioalkalivibrio sp.]|nr:hypothetical protein [Thioalkalivibrio sp.]
MAEEAPEAAASILVRARSIQRDRGPRAAADVLAEDLRALPDDTPGRADLYGELGNLRFLSGDVAAALLAYDSAVEALPEAERPSMLRRLAPLYDRFHPAGRSHLERFR